MQSGQSNTFLTLQWNKSSILLFSESLIISVRTSIKSSVGIEKPNREKETKNQFSIMNWTCKFCVNICVIKKSENNLIMRFDCYFLTNGEVEYGEVGCGMHIHLFR